MIFWILALSCKAPVSSLSQNKVSLISAEKNNWYGGREGLKGFTYSVKLRLKGKKDIITIKSFKAEGNIISFRQSSSEDIITVTGTLQTHHKTEDFADKLSLYKEEVSPKLNPKDNKIEFVTNNSKKTYSLNIPEFTSVEPVEELIPQRQ